MKVLHINRNYLTTPLHQVMIEHLNKTEIESTVFAPTDGKEVPAISPDENVIVSVCFSRRDRYFFSLKQRKIKNALCASCNVSTFDVIHAYTLFTDGNCAMRLSQEFRIPYIVAIRDTDVNTFFKKLPHLRDRGIKIMRNAARICFLSEAYRARVFARYVPQEYKDELLEKTEIIPNGIDSYWLENIYQDCRADSIGRIGEKKPRVVFVGKINRRKNLIAAQEGLRILSAAGWAPSFTIAGKAEERDLLRKALSYGNTDYLGPLDKKSLLELYRGSDIFLMPSHTETFGLVYAEAMSQGLPVIYTRGEGFDGQFPEGEVGYAVSDRNPQEIAAAVRKIAGNYERICHGCIRGASRYGWDGICRHYQQIYESVLFK